MFICEPLKLFSGSHLKLKMCVLLALASAKRVNELHDFAVKTRNALFHSFHFQELTISSLPDADGNREEILLCPVRTVKCYVSRSQ